MNKIKVIDLLNMISKGEEVPKKILLNRIVFEYQGDDYLYKDEDKKKYWLFSACYTDKYMWLEDFLKDEVEILDEVPKKIEKIEIYEGEDGHYFLNDRDKKIYIGCDEIDFMVDKFNELIDEINNLKEK